MRSRPSGGRAPSAGRACGWAWGLLRDARRRRGRGGSGADHRPRPGRQQPRERGPTGHLPVSLWSFRGARSMFPGVPWWCRGARRGRRCAAPEWPGRRLRGAARMPAARLRQNASWPRSLPCAWLRPRDGDALPRPCGGIRQLRARRVPRLREQRGAGPLPRPGGALRLRAPWHRPARWRGRNVRPRSACAAPRRIRRYAAARGATERASELARPALASRRPWEPVVRHCRRCGACRASRPRPACCGHG
ncbi:hypothetical protein ABH981_001020 [Bradyrhizobium ottawaense]